MAIETFFCFFSLVACSFKEKEKKPRNFEVAQLFVLGFFYYLNSAVFFFVRKFYMLRRLFGALYVDMRCFGVSWLFSKHKIPHPNQWGSMKNHKKYFHNRMLCRYFHVYPIQIRDLCKTFIYRKNLAYMTKISIYLCLEAYCNVYIGIIDAVKRLLSSIFVSNFLLFESIGHNYPWRSI